MANEKKTLAEQEDDFIFGDIKNDSGDDKSGNEKEKEVVEETDETAKSENVKTEKEEKVVEEKTKTSKQKESEKKDDESDEEEEEKEEEEDNDIFVPKLSSEDGSADKKISLKGLAKKFDVDLESEDESEFEAKLNEKLAKSRAEVNLDGFSDDAKAVIKHLNENNGDIESFFNNKDIIALQSVLALDAEQKVRNVRINEIMDEGKSRVDAIKIVDDELKETSTRQIRDIAADIDDQAKKLIGEELKKIVGDKEMKAAAERARKDAELVASKTNLKTFIEKQNNFLGLPLTADAKKLILRDIDNGTFDKVLTQNPEAIKFSSYMFSKYGEKIMKKIEGSISESNRTGFNAATKKHLSALHKSGETVPAKKTGHESPKRETGGSSKPKWSNEDFE